MTDEALEKIQNIIKTRKLEPGNRLPSERELSNELKIPRGYIRDAIKRMEFLGIVKVYPQKGIYVENGSNKFLEGLLAKTLNLDTLDIRSLLEVRASIEVTAAQLAAKRATNGSITKLQKILDEFVLQSQKNVPESKEEAFKSAEINCRFHLEIAEISKNSVIISLMKLILPDVLAFSRNNFAAYTPERVHLVVKEHTAIFEGIKKRDSELAENAMRIHMRKMSHIAEGLDKIFTLTNAPKQREYSRKNKWRKEHDEKIECDSDGSGISHGHGSVGFWRKRNQSRYRRKGRDKVDENRINRRHKESSW